MNWAPDGKAAIKREDGRFRIFRSPQHGHAPGKPIVFQLVDCGTHEVIAIERDVPDDRESILKVIRAMKAQAADA